MITYYYYLAIEIMADGGIGRCWIRHLSNMDILICSSNKQFYMGADYTLHYEAIATVTILC